MLGRKEDLEAGKFAHNLNYNPFYPMAQYRHLTYLLLLSREQVVSRILQSDANDLEFNLIFS